MAIVGITRAEVLRLIAAASGGASEEASGDAYRYGHATPTGIQSTATFVPADLDLVANHLHGFSLINGDTLRYDGASTRSFVVQGVVGLQSGNNEELMVAIAVNGSVSASITYLSTGGGGRVAAAPLLLHTELFPDDEVTIFVANLDSTNDITVADCYLLVHS
jgi:hypothetical protein